ncbi:MAG: hypothetical protein NNA25_08910 [Nitrospira sp.]|nr:hypothetical protein [Nitrospira sp.]
MRRKHEEGGTLLEAMVAAAIAGVMFMGTMETVGTAARFVHRADMMTRAQSIAQSRLEAKRSVAWPLLLAEDVDGDGAPDTVMRDDGTEPDEEAGDGVYSAMTEHRGLTEKWMIEIHGPVPLASAGMVTITAVVTFEDSDGWWELRMKTMRANPAFVGSVPR